MKDNRFKPLSPHLPADQAVGALTARARGVPLAAVEADIRARAESEPRFSTDTDPRLLAAKATVSEQAKIHQYGIERREERTVDLCERHHAAEAAWRQARYPFVIALTLISAGILAGTAICLETIALIFAFADALGYDVNRIIAEGQWTTLLTPTGFALLVTGFAAKCGVVLAGRQVPPLKRIVAGLGLAAICLAVKSIRLAGADTGDIFSILTPFLPAGFALAVGGALRALDDYENDHRVAAYRAARDTYKNADRDRSDNFKAIAVHRVELAAAVAELAYLADLPARCRAAVNARLAEARRLYHLGAWLAGRGDDSQSKSSSGGMIAPLVLVAVLTVGTSCTPTAPSPSTPAAPATPEHVVVLCDFSSGSTCSAEVVRSAVAAFLASDPEPNALLEVLTPARGLDLSAVAVIYALRIPMKYGAPFTQKKRAFRNNELERVRAFALPPGREGHSGVITAIWKASRRMAEIGAAKRTLVSIGDLRSRDVCDLERHVLDARRFTNLIQKQGLLANLTGVDVFALGVDDHGQRGGWSIEQARELRRVWRELFKRTGARSVVITESIHFDAVFRRAP